MSSSKGSNFTFGKRSKEVLEGVHPDLQRLMEKALELSKVDFSVIEGLRTPERQRELVELGKSLTQNSRHLSGGAVDVAAWVDGKTSWDWEHYEEIWKAVRAASQLLDVAVEWGGLWEKLLDGGHFQLPHGYMAAVKGGAKAARDLHEGLQHLLDPTADSFEVHKSNSTVSGDKQKPE